MDKLLASLMNKILNQNPLLLLLVILIGGFLLYIPSISFDFLSNFDDDQLIVQNPQVQSFKFGELINMFNESVFGLYHPITTLSWAIENYFFGNNPRIYHLNNIILHLINTSLLFFFISSLLKNKKVALFSCLLFVVHPMHVENISWLSSRKDLVYAFFFILGLIQYLKYRRSNNKYHLLITYLWFLLSLFSKSNAVVFPVLLILIDYYLDQKIQLRKITAKIPFFLFSLIFIYITINTQSEAGFIKDFSQEYSWYNRLVLIFYSLAFYFWHLIIPFPLFPKNLYPQETNGLLPFLYYFGLPFLVGIWLVVKKIRSNQKLWLFGILFFLLIISPVLKIIPTGNDIVSNRYVYLPYIGLYIIWGYLLLEVKVKWLRVVSPILIIVFILQSYNYQNVYSDSVTVWTSVIKSTKGNESAQAMAYNERGQVYFKQKDYRRAFQDITKALDLNPTLYRGLLNRAIIYDQEGNLELALSDLNTAIKQDTNSVDARKLRGMIYAKLSQPNKALTDFNIAMKIDSLNHELFNNRGIANSILENYQAAEKDFNRALELSPENSEYLSNKARLLLKKGDNKKAIELYKLLKHKNNNLNNSILLAMAYLHNNETGKAIELFDKFQNNTQANASIGNALMNQKFYELSIVYFKKAMKDEKIAPQMQYMISRAYLQLGDTAEAISNLEPLTIKVKDPQLYFELGAMYYSNNTMEAACRYWRLAREQGHQEAALQIDKYCN